MRWAYRGVHQRRLLTTFSVVNVLLMVGAVVGLLTATGDDSSKHGKAAGPKPTATRSSRPVAPSTPTANGAAYPCTWKKTGKPSRPVRPPSTTEPPRTGTVRVSVTTSRGEMIFTLDRDHAPCAVASFLSLAEQNFYDRTPCHRLTTGPTLFMLQCGDPTGTGYGGPGYSFTDELTGREKYPQGVVAMANSGANTNGSDFFVVYRDSQLPPSYTVFGHVTSGLGVVRKVADGGSPDNDGRPRVPIDLLDVGKLT